MATIRDVVEALSRSTGVDADSVAALLPTAIKHMAQLGDAGGRGDFTSAVLEFGGGLAVVAVLHADALLIVLCNPRRTWAPSCSTCVDTAQPSLVCFSPVRR